MTTLEYPTDTSLNNTSSIRFAELDARYAAFPLSNQDSQRFGQIAVENARILETPADVLAAGDVLTNPSQIEVATINQNGQDKKVEFAYFRREPKRLHLGKTAAVPYIITDDSVGIPRLREFAEAKVLPGEDPRLMLNIPLKGPTGKVHSGWAVSTVVATPKADHPEDVASIKQVFYWGETLASLEPVAEIFDLKNTCIFPRAQLNSDTNDTSLIGFGRPHPHITMFTAPDLSQITKELVENGQNITQDFLAVGFHTGVNTIKSIPGQPDYLELDIHEATAPVTETGKTLHYRLGRYGIQLSTGRLIPLGTVATRYDFPDCEPKPPENGVLDYRDILYGSAGHLSRMVTGVSDSHVGIADIVRS